MQQYFYGGDPRPYFLPIEQNDFCTLATLLDPRFKDKRFTTRVAAAAAKERLIEEVEKIIDPQSNEAVVAPKKLKTGDLSSFWYEEESSDENSDVALATTSRRSDSLEVIQSLARNEVSKYFSMETINPLADPMDFYKIQQNEFPHLSKLAMKYLCPPCSNVASEREFSTASDIANFERNRLNPENVNKLMFLKYGLRAIGYNTIDLK